MNVTQMSTILNELANQKLGENEVASIDLTNVVATGKAIAEIIGYDNLVKSIVDKVGYTILVNREYSSVFPDIHLRDYEYGSILEKIRIDLPDATSNETWGLNRGDTPNQFEFQPPVVTANYWNNKDTFSIWYSYGEEQLKESFKNETTLLSFFSAIENAVRQAITIREEANTSIAICNFALTKSKTQNGCINLLGEYNTLTNAGLTLANCRRNVDFLKFCAKTIMLYKKRLNSMSTLFNVGNVKTFTPDDRMKFVMLDEFNKDMEMYLESDTYHNELVALTGFETIPYWQGTGTEYSFEDTAKMTMKLDGDESATTLDNVVGVIFDIEAVSINNTNYRITTSYNAKGEFINYFHKYDYTLFNDLNENGIIFYLAED